MVDQLRLDDAKATRPPHGVNRQAVCLSKHAQGETNALLHHSLAASHRVLYHAVFTQSSFKHLEGPKLKHSKTAYSFSLSSRDPRSRTRQDIHVCNNTQSKARKPSWLKGFPLREARAHISPRVQLLFSISHLRSHPSLFHRPNRDSHSRGGHKRRASLFRRTSVFARPPRNSLAHRFVFCILHRRRESKLRTSPFVSQTI